MNALIVSAFLVLSSADPANTADQSASVVVASAAEHAECIWKYGEAEMRRLSAKGRWPFLLKAPQFRQLYQSLRPNCIPGSQYKPNSKELWTAIDDVLSREVPGYKESR